jgi:hypothetical protein
MPGERLVSVDPQGAPRGRERATGGSRPSGGRSWPAHAIVHAHALDPALAAFAEHIAQAAAQGGLELEPEEPWPGENPLFRHADSIGPKRGIWYNGTILSMSAVLTLLGLLLGVSALMPSPLRVVRSASAADKRREEEIVFLQLQVPKKESREEKDSEADQFGKDYKEVIGVMDHLYQSLHALQQRRLQPPLARSAVLRARIRRARGRDPLLRRVPPFVRVADRKTNHVVLPRLHHRRGRGLQHLHAHEPRRGERTVARGTARVRVQNVPRPEERPAQLDHERVLEAQERRRRRRADRPCAPPRPAGRRSSRKSRPTC